MTETLRGAARLLVVDDNKVNRLLLARNLESMGHHVAMAENGRLALAALRQGGCDLVLLDIEMPEMDGFQVLEQIRGDLQLRDVPVLVTSSVEGLENVNAKIKLEELVLAPDHGRGDGPIALAEEDTAAGLGRLARAHHGDHPRRRGHPLDQRLDPATAVLETMQARLDHPGVVEDQQVARLQQAFDVGKREVFETVGQHPQQARVGAIGERVLGNQLGRQIEIEIGKFEFVHGLTGQKRDKPRLPAARHRQSDSAKTSLD